MTAAAALCACSTVEKSPSRLWVREWNGLEQCHRNPQESHPCSYEEVIPHAEQADWSRTRRAILGLIDQSADTTPIVDPVEWQILYAVVLIPHLRTIEDYNEYVRRKSALPAERGSLEAELNELVTERAVPCQRKTPVKGETACPTDERAYHALNDQINAVQKRLRANEGDQLRYEKLVAQSAADLPRAKERGALYVRRLLELPNRESFTHYLLSRANEDLYGANYPSDVSIPPRAREWDFRFTASPSADSYVLADFKERYNAAAREMRGGYASEMIHAGVPILWGGLRFDDSLLVNQMKGKVTLRVIDGSGKNELIWRADLQPKNGNHIQHYPVIALSEAEAREKIRKIFWNGVEIYKVWRAAGETVLASVPSKNFSGRSPASFQENKIENGGK